MSEEEEKVVIFRISREVDREVRVAAAQNDMNKSEFIRQTLIEKLINSQHTRSEIDVVARLADLEGGLSQAALIRRLIHKAANEHGISLRNDSRNEITKINGNNNKSSAIS